MTQASTQVQARRKIPKQPECNVGTSGHVDHGKCLTLDQYVLMNGRLMTGREIADSIGTSGRLLETVDGGSFYQLTENVVVSLDDGFRAVRAESLFYVQPYDGTIYSFLTDSGRFIKVTPEHPLLVNRRGSLQWVKAREIRSDDYLTFLSVVPTSNPPSFPDPVPYLKGRFSMVEYEDFTRLWRLTGGFINYSALGYKEFDQIRLLVGLSLSKLSRMARLGERRLKGFLDGRESLSQVHLSRLREALASRSVVELHPGEMLVVTKRPGRWSARKLSNADLDVNLMKWLAFVWAEGTSTAARIRVAQSVQIGMLREFMRITKRKFGLQFKRVSEVDYALSCRALVDLLRAKFSFQPGNESVCGIADWVLGCSAELRSTFLRWFLTLEGEFNARSGQVVISQLNERNIVTLGYLLQTFGIVPRFSLTRCRTKKGIRTYSRLCISGRENLFLFSRIIGFQDQRIQSKLLHYLSSIQQQNKGSDFSLPVDVEQLASLLAKSSVLREPFIDPDVRPMKKSRWYKAYSGARLSGRISRPKLLSIIASVEEHLALLESSLPQTCKTAEDLRAKMRLTRVSLERAAKELGVTRKRLSGILRKSVPSQLNAVEDVVRRLTAENLRDARLILDQFRLLARSTLVFDKLRGIEQESYSGLIFDLSVPKHGNFVAGIGAIVAHNTTIVQLITGVWASAHSEELKRGITIKVGYADAAFYKCHNTPPPAAYSTLPVCPVCGRETELLRCVSFVDCPGHESLMTNMLAGAALMDGSLLVIAANEPVPRPQTREHLQALQMLGMKKIVVVQNKIDLIDDEAAKKNHDAIKNFISNTVAADAPIIPISAQHNINGDALIEAIEQEIPTPKRDPAANALMHVLRSFDVNKPGIDISSMVGGVLGGSLVRGRLRVGDEIEILPGLADEKGGKFSPLTTRIEGLGTGAGMAQEVGPGGLVAVGTQLDPTVVKADLMVGSILGKPGTLPPVWSHVKLDLQLFESAVGSTELVKVEKVRKEEALRLNVGTASVLATVASARDSTAELELRKPIAAEANSRAAVSRRIAERWRLIGSGVIM